MGSTNRSSWEGFAIASGAINRRQADSLPLRYRLLNRRHRRAAEFYRWLEVIGQFGGILIGRRKISALKLVPLI